MRRRGGAKARSKGEPGSGSNAKNMESVRMLMLDWGLTSADQIHDSRTKRSHIEPSAERAANLAKLKKISRIKSDPRSNSGATNAAAAVAQLKIHKHW